MGSPLFSKRILLMIKPQYQATPDTLTDKQYSGLRVDQTGALVTTSDGEATSLSLLEEIRDLLIQIEANTSGA